MDRQQRVALAKA